MPTRSAACANVATVSLVCEGPQVDHTYDVTGVGSVVSGLLLEGRIHLGHCLLLGPMPHGGFSEVAVTCIQRAQVMQVLFTILQH